MNSIHAAEPRAGRADAALVHSAMQWRVLCRRADLVANSGVVAWVEDRQVAVFYLPDGEVGKQVFAIENRDPRSGANVIGRGIIGQLQGDLVVASPLYKQHFRLDDGSCVEYADQRLEVWPVRLSGDDVQIGLA